MGQSALQSGDHRLGTVGHIQAHQYDTHVRLFGGTAGSGSRGEGSILAYGGSAILDGVAMSNGLVGWVLQETDTAGINFVHAAGVMGDIARRAALHNNHLQSGARCYLFGHHEAALSAADDDYIRGFEALHSLSPAKDAQGDGKRHYQPSEQDRHL
jgi:hypothetical protein